MGGQCRGDECLCVGMGGVCGVCGGFVGKYVECVEEMRGVCGEICGVWRVGDECVGSMECCEMCGT